MIFRSLSILLVGIILTYLGATILFFIDTVCINYILTNVSEITRIQKILLYSMAIFCNLVYAIVFSIALVFVIHKLYAKLIYE